MKNQNYHVQATKADGANIEFDAQAWSHIDAPSYSAGVEGWDVQTGPTAQDAITALFQTHGYTVTKITEV